MPANSDLGHCDYNEDTMRSKERIRDSKNGFEMSHQKLSKLLPDGLQAGEQGRDQR